jgi:hypothetical protein
MWWANQQVTKRLLIEEISEQTLDETRAVFRASWADYQARRGEMAASSGEYGRMFTPPADIEDQIKETVTAFVSQLAGALGFIATAMQAAHTGAVPRPR